MHSLNLGILAHVDAGKTSLTERLLYTAGVIDQIGSVDAGNAKTDTLALEQQRGISIRSAVVSFEIAGRSVNLIDTPGHPDFIAEVERVLSVLDGAVLVISAVEGVQAQTRILMHTLQRLGIPTVIFVNKIDRAGARDHGLLADITRRLTPDIIAMGGVDQIGTADVSFTLHHADDEQFTANLIDLIANHDEAFLERYVIDPEAITYADLCTQLATQTQRARVHPVYFGSAITGAGVDALMDGIAQNLPVTSGEDDGPVSATIFKIERGPAGEKLAYARIFSGTISARDKLPLPNECEAKVTGISVFERGETVQRTSGTAGQIAILRGLDAVQVGDVIGEPRSGARQHHFGPPTLETGVVPCQESQRGHLFVALSQLAEQDPLINVRRAGDQGAIFVSLYGEVQKEVIQQTLASDYDIDVDFLETTTIYIERPVGVGEALEVINQDPNPFLATIGLRIEPAPVDSGMTFQLGVELGSMPLAFFVAVEESVRETLQQGIHGWQVTDCLVTMTHSGYWARQSTAHGGFDKSMSSTARDFRQLTPLVLMFALKQAMVEVCEPVHAFELELPIDCYGAAVAALTKLRAIPLNSIMREKTAVIEGEIPAEQVHMMRQLLPGIARGEGLFESSFDRYQPVSGEPPCRPRTDNNPLNRKEYLLHTLRRV